MRKNFVVFFVSAVLVAGCGARLNFSTKPPRGVKIVSLPEWHVGDTWTINRSWNTNRPSKHVTSTVVQKTKTGYIVQKKNKKQFFYEKNLKYLGSGSKGRLKKKGPMQIFNFPIWVGKAWKQVQKIRTSSGRSRTYSSVFHVDSAREISVPAGKFLVYVIVEERTNIKTYTSTEFVRYYSPKVKRIIKREGGWRSSSSYELISYKVK